MLDDATFLKAARAQFEGAKRLTGTTTMTADHALRMLEMAERWHAEHHHDNDRVIADMVKSWEDVPPLPERPARPWSPSDARGPRLS